MYICYADESGHCGRKYNPSQPVEVVCGVISDVTKLFKSQREHSALLEALGLPEIKSSNVYRGRKEWAQVPAEDRDALFDTVFGWADERVAKILLCPIDSKKFFDEKKKGSEFATMLDAPYEAGAVNLILAVERHQRSKKNNKGKTFVILDEQAKHDEHLIRILAGDLSFTDGYTGFTPKSRAKTRPPRLNQIVDIPHFSKSHLAILIQVADLAAYVVNRCLCLEVYGHDESYPGEREKVRGWMAQISGNLLSHTATDPPGKDTVVEFFRRIRPNRWDPKLCQVQES